MCTGHTHALTGLVTGLAAGELVLHLPLPQTAGLALLTAGAAVLPDVDHPNSTLAHSFGFLTEFLARVIGKVSGGHRRGTHSSVGVVVFTLAAAAGVRFRHDWPGRIGLGVLLAIVIASGLIALRVGNGHRSHWLLGARVGDAVAIGAAVGMTVFGTGLALVAIAMGLGCATHVYAGDSFTDEGCPWGWPFIQRNFRWVPEPLAFTTGTAPEAAFAAAFGAGFLVLAARGVLVAVDPAAWASLMHAVAQTPHLI